LKIAHHALAALATSAALLAATAAIAHTQLGQKLDSGLGALPPYSEWLDKSGRDPMLAGLPGESLDNGLGELPPYALWRDQTGRDPMGNMSVAEAVTASR
jgi:hypothetical protein